MFVLLKSMSLDAFNLHFFIELKSILCLLLENDVLLGQFQLINFVSLVNATYRLGTAANFEDLFHK